MTQPATHLPVATVNSRFVGRLLAAADTHEVVDAHLIAVALRLGDAVLTGDVEDLSAIAAPLGPSAPTIRGWP